MYTHRTCHESHNAVALSLDHLKQLPDERGHRPGGHALHADQVHGVGVVVLRVPMLHRVGERHVRAGWRAAAFGVACCCQSFLPMRSECMFLAANFN